MAQHHEVKSECGSYNYLLFVPEGYSSVGQPQQGRGGGGGAVPCPPRNGWPLLLFLHGANHKGANLDALRSTGIPRLCEDHFTVSSSTSDIKKIERHGLSMSDLEDEEEEEDEEEGSPRTSAAGIRLSVAAALARRSPHRRTPSGGSSVSAWASMGHSNVGSFPFVVISPLCPPFKYWRIQSLSCLLEEAIERFDIDPTRIYAVGEGMGGWAACALAANTPRSIAACVSIDGSTDPSFVGVSQLKETPLWLFHEQPSTFDQDDYFVCDEESEEEEEDRMMASMRLAEMLRQEGGRSVLFTAYPSCSSSSSSSSCPSTPYLLHTPDEQNEAMKRSFTYDNPLLYQWLLQHSLPLSEA